MAPTCYRHPKRETWVSCGRCGKPLCPDCVQHGPVGVRCAECLRPSGGRVSGDLHAPESMKRAVGIALAQAVLWFGLLLWIGWQSGTAAPNLLIAGTAGGLIGWSIWRNVGRTWNRSTVSWAIGISAATTLLASVVLYMILLGPFILQHPAAFMDFFWLTLIRPIAATLLSAFFAWLFACQRRNPTW